MNSLEREMLKEQKQKGRAQVKKAMSEMIADDDKYFALAPIVWDGLSYAEREVLNQLLHQGPVADGNVISKCDRDNLIEYGLAARCCYKGEQGYTAATYEAFSVFKAGKAEPFKVKEPSSK